MSRAELEVIATWCDARDVHLVSDEIYALSVFAGSHVSLGSLGPLGPKRHVLWGLSKDFGMSGLRFGVAWTENKELSSAMTSASIFTGVSGPVQVGDTLP